MKLDQNISELLFQYDCVIVPEFGGFVTNYCPAKLDENASVFSPPTKALSFNRFLKKNDGLLAKYIADKESLSFEEVNDQLRLIVEDFFTQLNKGERVVFDKVGILYLDKAKKIQFSPDLSTNYLLDSFGLRRVYAHGEEVKETESVKLIPHIEILQRETPKKEKVAEIAISDSQVPEKQELEELDEGLKRRIWRSAAVIVPLAFLSYFLTEPTQMGKTNLSNLNPFKDSIPQMYQERVAEMVLPETNVKTDFPDLFDLPQDKKTIMFSLTDDPNDAVVIDVRPKEELIEKKTTTNSLVVESHGFMAPATISSKRYHVIAGCFGEMRNAEKKTKKLRRKGYDAFIIDKRKGLFRVVYGSASGKNEAMILLQAVKQNEDRSAWLLKK